MTELIYLKNQDLYKSEATVMEIIKLENGLGVILDKTIFYVQGGGQPGDKGIITSGNVRFEVLKMIFNEQGQAVHIGSFENADFKIGDVVGLQIDEVSRKLNTRIHSAGHLIDLAIKNIGLKWKPAKSYHYPEGSYIEYEIENSQNFTDPLPQLIMLINEQYNKLVNQNLPFNIRLDTSSSYKGQPLRIVSIAGLIECPCSGTHVKSTTELSGFEVTKIKIKNNLIKLSYSLV